MYLIKPMFFLVLLVSFYTVVARANTTLGTSDVDYGEMYVIQKQADTQKLWKTNLAYSYGFSDPYNNVHGFQGEISRQLGKFTRLGISPAYYATSSKGVASEISARLGAQGIQTTSFTPNYSGHLTFGVTPLSGLLNWFNTTSVSFDLVAGIGTGVVKYDQESRYSPSIRLFLVPEAMVSNTWGFSAGIQTLFDRMSAGDWLNRVDMIVGAAARL